VGPETKNREEDVINRLGSRFLRKSISTKTEGGKLFERKPAKTKGAPCRRRATEPAPKCAELLYVNAKWRGQGAEKKLNRGGG